MPSFGKHGILKASDLPRMQRTFDVWLAEVKGVQNQKLPKWELQNYFDSFREDYNTATLPHAKYYDYDKWEMQEYTRQQEAAAALEHAVASGGRISVLTDERAHAAERQRLRETKEAAALQLTAATMNPNKVADMKRQEQLRTQMQVAFRTGDKDTYRKLKEKLEADE